MTLVALMGEDADVTRSVNRTRLITSLLLALGVVVIVISAAKARTGADQQDLPEGIEAVRPEKNAQVPQQTTIVVDLSPGYDGTLILNGTEIPSDQVSFDEGQNELTFPCQPVLDGSPAAAGNSGANSARPPQPPCIRNQPNAELVKIPRGNVAISVQYWKIATGRSAGSRVYFWSFRTT
ncbi:MAG: hypothetical protein JWL70_1153 [Acidimicrobiia bacterium]|nr:hypothetical protein [Acidimicrobiia bacterium]